MAVDRLKKLAEPLDPNKLPADPVPKAAPTSAPLPCWISTRPITPAAANTCTNQIKFSIILHATERARLCSLGMKSLADTKELRNYEGSTADQYSIDITLNRIF